MKRMLGLVFALLVAGAFLSYGITSEVPVGAVKGVVTMAENGRPLGDVLVTLTPVVQPKDDRPAERYATTSPDGTFSLAHVAAGQYQVEASASEHHLEDTTVTVEEGKPAHFEIQMSPSEPYLTLYTSQRVFTPDETPKIEIHGFVPDNSLDITVRKLSLDAVAKRGGFQQTLSSLAQPETNEAAIDPNDVSSIFNESKYTITKKDAEGAFIEPLPLPPLPEGFYWISCDSDGQHSSAFINISRIAMISKSDGKKSLTYVVDMKSGQPISGAEILATRDHRLTATETTGKDGCATVTLPSKADDRVVAARSGSSVALCSLMNTNNGEEDGDDASTESSGPDRSVHIFTYTDRPVYRPGDLVQFKSIVRTLLGTEYRLPSEGNAKIDIQDPDQNLIQTLRAKISSHGTLHGQFRTSSEAKPGVYTVIVHAAGATDRYFVNLAAYHKPDVKITTNVQPGHHIIGDNVKVDIDAEYYFGGPVAGAKVIVDVYRTPDWSQLAGADDPELDDVDDADESANDNQVQFDGGEYTQQITETTDTNGHATIEVPTRADNDPDSIPLDYQYNADVSIEDGSDRTANDTAKILATRGGFGLSADADREIAAKGDTVDVSVKALNYQDSHSALSGRAVALEVGETRWTRNTSVFIPRATMTAITGSDGVAHFPVTVDSTHSLSFKATTTDDAGHKIAAETYLYVVGSPVERGEAETKFSVHLDKKKYALGDEALVKISTNDPGGVALLTLQAEHVIWSATVPLRGVTTYFKTPLTKECSPNAYVSVAYIHNKNFMEGTRSVRVYRDDRRLAVTVKPDTPATHPGETVSFTIHTALLNGRGTPAEVSLGLVDESIYAIQPDSTDVFRGMYPRRSNLVDTEFSFPDVYLDGGDKAGGSVPIRTHFEDTASWSPTVETGPDGNAKVTVKLPDNLTTWRATAIGVTDDSQAGMTVAKIVSNKPLMLRIQAPSFMVKTDQQAVNVQVTNDTGHDQNVHLSFACTGVVFRSDPPASVSLAAGATGSVPLDVDTPATGAASIVAKAWTDDGSKDGVQSTFNVEPHGRLFVDNQSGDIVGEHAIDVVKRDGVDPSAGRLLVSLTPSVASGMLESLDALVQFPYGCVEQTTSRFLPAALVTDMLRKQGRPRLDWEKRTKSILSDGFARLATMQHGDGGWGWWTYDQSDPFMTAWVLDALSRLKQIGIEPPPTIRLKAALDWVATRTRSVTSDEADVRLYLLAIQGRYHRLDNPIAQGSIYKMVLNMRKTDQLQREWALAGLAAVDTGDEASKPLIVNRLDQVLDDRQRALAADWTEFYEDEDTSLALLALTELKPDDRRIPDLVGRLCRGRSVDGWESTRAITFAVEGLTAYLQRTKEGSSPVDIQVSLNGTMIRQIHLDSDQTTGPDLKITVPMNMLNSGENRLEFLRQGAGTSYYATECRQYVDQPILGQVLSGSGLTVERHYYLLKARAMEDGSMKLLPSPTSIDQVTAGDIVQVVLTVRTSKAMDFLMIEDPIPSNCRVTERTDMGDDGEWSWWWCNLSIFDDRVAFFARTLPEGEQTIRYTMRAEDVGVSHALPTRVANMCDPKQSAQSADNQIEVTR